MFMPPSPKILVIFESVFCSEIKVAMTSVFFLDLARLNSASSRSLEAFAGSSVINRTKPNSPASAMISEDFDFFCQAETSYRTVILDGYQETRLLAV
jgi:hypothetical protein